MKLPTLVVLSASLALGHVVPGAKRSLVTRNEQKVENLDNEEDFEIGHSGDHVPKSRILTGVGPEQAVNRLFDWDESCTDAGQRNKILSTFTSMLTLSDWTSSHLQQLKEGLPNTVGTSANKDNKKAIFEKDPAFAQMFLGEDNRIGYVKETFDLVTSNAQKPASERGGLRFICNKENKVLTGDGKAPYCGEGAEAAQAIATGPYDYKYHPTIEPKYSFELSSSITFCPAFFDDSQFPNIEVLDNDHAEKTLDRLDCAERVLLHEFMHLPWVRNMPGKPDKPDYTGYWEAADYARVAKWGFIKFNPDNYAWLAIYAYFNNHNGGCKRDVWPSDQDRPNKPPT